MSVSHIVDLLTVDDLMQVIQKQNYNNQILMRTFNATQKLEGSNVEEQLAALRAVVTELIDEVAPLEADVANLLTAVNGLTTWKGTIDTWKTQVNTKIATLETKVATCEATLADHERRIKALEKA
ncbi:MAG: hypothetical protein KBT28_01585 [Bacteroidales bacterium]|nr:hypothetical protein [Candidatus Colimorpha merdihippi]